MKAKSILMMLVLFMIVGGFSIVPYVLQANIYNPKSTPVSNVQVPDSGVLGYSLTPQQEVAILQTGKAIIRFEYNLTCDGCFELKDNLEKLIFQKQLKDEVVLEEVESKSGDLPKVTIVGFILSGGQYAVQQKALQGKNATQTEIFNSLCDLTIKPPVECALRNG